jgi:predicted ATP-grasp superfamily ATP-dependent carboligase
METVVSAPDPAAASVGAGPVIDPAKLIQVRTDQLKRNECAGFAPLFG